jgi:nucleoid-associated protein EbfC
LTFLTKTDIFFEPIYFKEHIMAGLPNMSGMMKQIQKMQEKMAKVQQELETKTVLGESGGGMVKVTVTGKERLVKIQIEKEVVNPEDIEMLEDLILAATNKGLEEAARMAQEEMSKATSGMIPNIPGMNIPGLGF